MQVEGFVTRIYWGGLQTKMCLAQFRRQYRKIDLRGNEEGGGGGGERGGGGKGGGARLHDFPPRDLLFILFGGVLHLKI